MRKLQAQALEETRVKQLEAIQFEKLKLEKQLKEVTIKHNAEASSIRNLKHQLKHQRKSKKLQNEKQQKEIAKLNALIEHQALTIQTYQEAQLAVYDYEEIKKRNSGINREFNKISKFLKTRA